MRDLAPIAVFAYKRPEHCLRTLRALENNTLARDSALYIFADGCKESSNVDENRAIMETRSVIRQEKWCKEVFIRESPKNKGLADSIIDGVSEVVGKHGKIIVLEDDVVPSSPYFLQYMNDALDFYENEAKVWHISGYAHPFYADFGVDTFFSKYMSCWGWATWVDRWNFFEKNPKAILSRINRKEKSGFTYRNQYKALRHIKANVTGEKNTWAAFWYATIYLNGGLCLNPGISFVQNIGMDGSGVHCGVASSYRTGICKNYPIKLEADIRETAQTRAVFEKKLSGKNKKLILLRPNGQHSNRLIQNLHFEAFCLEHGVEYRNPTFVEGDYYMSPCSAQTNAFINLLRVNLLGPMFRHATIVKKLFSVAWLLSKAGLVKYIDFDKTKKDKDVEKMLLRALEKSNTVYVSGWWFRVSELIEKHRGELTARYSLKPKFYENNGLYKKLLKLKSEENVLIGVHIRRGDYKQWLGGRYYFDDVYESYMKDLSRRLSEKTDKNQVFIIFSNDVVKFAEAENMFVSKEDWYIDHHIMSLCDYLIGPRSTFPLWASYIGGNTYFSIRDGSGKIENTVCDCYYSSTD